MPAEIGTWSCHRPFHGLFRSCHHRLCHHRLSTQKVLAKKPWLFSYLHCSTTVFTHKTRRHYSTSSVPQGCWKHTNLLRRDWKASVLFQEDALRFQSLIHDSSSVLILRRCASAKLWKARHCFLLELLSRPRSTSDPMARSLSPRCSTLPSSFLIVPSWVAGMLLTTDNRTAGMTEHA